MQLTHVSFMTMEGNKAPRHKCRTVDLIYFSQTLVECKNYPLQNAEGLFVEYEIRRIVGIMDTNSHEIFNRNGVAVKGIYPLVSFLSHSCIINARPRMLREAPFTNVLYANVVIPKGNLQGYIY